jgi:hypothetical protein
MSRLLRWIFTGYSTPPASNRALAVRLDDLEERHDYLVKQVRRLRGHITGGIRYPEGDDDDGDDGLRSAGFPEERFQSLLKAKRGDNGTG